MIRGKPLSALLFSMAIVAGCGPKLLVPPRLDLVELYRVGLVRFTIENAKGSLNEIATEYFAEEVFVAQQGVEVLELGTLEQVLEEIGRESFDSRAARAMGDEYDVSAVFLGHLTASNVKPRAALYEFPGLEAVVSVRLTVRLISTESGATLWSNSAHATETVGELGLSGDDIYFSAEDPYEAYGHLVEHLVYEVTKDLRPTYR